MSSVQPAKPLISAIITLVWLACFVFIDINGSFFQYFNYSYGDANALKWGIIAAVGIIWLLFQIFFDAPSEASRLSLAVSGSILWLGLILFYHFADPAYGGVVAFFTLVGGLGIVIIWTRYLADEF
jgi:hypothetical protein